jgi:hypothetical protein
MTEFERSLEELASQIEWPATPALTVRFERQRHFRRPLVLVVALASIALVVAFAVPDSRSAIIRFFHFGGVTIERVEVLPPAQERSLAAGLGRPVTAAEAEQALGAPVRLPATDGQLQLYLRDGFVSALLATPGPVLLTEFRSGGGSALLKKLVGGSTGVVAVQVDVGTPGVWIAGEEHVLLAPPAPPRLAGNVLLWQEGEITLRLEGRDLTEQNALRLAREIDGT